MSEQHAEHQHQVPKPDAVLRSLDRLVGKWAVSGGTEGTVNFEWMEGGFFLIQHVDLVQHGMQIKGTEIIGRKRPFGATEPSPDITSRYYDTMGNTFDYVYEFDGETLTVWGGEKGSPAYYRGELSSDGNTLTGAWVYPGGGGYESTSIRVG